MSRVEQLQSTEMKIGVCSARLSGIEYVAKYISIRNIYVCVVI